MSSDILFEDKFAVKNIDDSKFERVSRIEAAGLAFNATLIFDLNSSIYPIKKNDVIKVALASSIVGGNRMPDDHSMWWRSSELMNSQLMEENDYVMCGKVFHFEDLTNGKRTIHISFGGLLLSLTTERQTLTDIQMDSRVFICVKKL